ncbi:MAG TPA: hypothetical protein PKY50_15540 [Candidatus Competibacter sp.]|nr:hypothetical protein [Candidatus Competibacter sp.]
MTEKERAQFAVYADEAAIPRYQRAWVWGMASLAILLCGLAAGWLFGNAGSDSGRDPPSAVRFVDGDALLARQEAVNRQLQERIARLEQALANDACGPMALEALTQNARDP